MEGILNAIGKTPLVRLTKLMPHAPFRIYAKVESLNPGGSMKDRAAINMVKHGLETGAIRAETVIIESSSGNMGIGLAQVCAYYGLRFVCVVDPKTTHQNLALLRALGAEIDMVSQPDPETGEFLKARLDRVQHLVKNIENGYWPNQYANLHNARAYRATMDEILADIRGNIDYLFCAVSTCGTLRGCSEYVAEHNLDTRIIAVDAVGSVIFGGEKCKRLIPGHGAARVPELFCPGLAQEYVHASDLDCVVGCRRLASQEAIVAGGSSGALVMALQKVQEKIPPDSNCVLILPDRGERYLDTIYSDAWVVEHFGDVSHLWQDPGTKTCVSATS